MSSGAFWAGRPLEELTKEELIEALLFLDGELRDIRTPANITAIAQAKAQAKVKEWRECIR